MAGDNQRYRLAGRIGAHVQHARHDVRATTAAGHDAFMRRFEQEVDPEGVLTAEERARRAGHALRAHMARLAMKSALARKRGGAE